jgi:hypothetical protein
MCCAFGEDVGVAKPPPHFLLFEDAQEEMQKVAIADK